MRPQHRYPRSRSAGTCRRWAVRRSLTDSQFTGARPLEGTAETRVEYASLQDGVAVPSRVRITHQFGTVLKLDEDFVFSEFEHRPSPPAEFTLSHFQLPEAAPPGTVEENQGRLQVTPWVLLHLAIGLGFLALLFQRSLRRRRQGRTDPPRHAAPPDSSGDPPQQSVG